MPESLLPPASTTRRGVNPSKFMGASFAAGSGLEKRVENNERKITSLKNIIKQRKVNVDKLLPASSDGKDKDQTIITNNLADRLDNIAQTLGVLTRALKQQFNVDKKIAAEEKRDRQQEEKKDRERNLKSRSGKFVSGVTGAITKPFKGFFQSLIDFFKNILLGAGLLALIKWLKDPENQAKIKEFWDFITKTLPKLIDQLIDSLKKVADKLEWLTNPLMKAINETLAAGRRARLRFDRWWRKRKNKKKRDDDDDKKGGGSALEPSPVPVTAEDPSTVVQGALGGAKDPSTVVQGALGGGLSSGDSQAVGVNAAKWADIALVLTSLIGIVAPEPGTTFAGIAGIIKWMRGLSRLHGLVDLIRKTSNQGQQGAPIRNMNFNMAREGNGSGVQIASSDIRTTIGPPLSSNKTQVINLGDGGPQVATNNSIAGGNDVAWFPARVGTDDLTTRSTLSLVT